MARLFSGKGPRLGTKIMLLGLTLLVIPYFSYRQLVEMERLLIQGQSHAQLLTAEGISTLFNGREDLFNDLPLSSSDYEALYAHSLQQPIRLDGQAEDWGLSLADKFIRFRPSSGAEEPSFEMLLGERGGQLHLFIRISDDRMVYRDPDRLRLDQADHVRLSFIGADGEDVRLSLTAPRPGQMTTYQMDENWRFAELGIPEKDVQGYAVATGTGLNIELRLPLNRVGSKRYFGVTYMDVDDPVRREVSGIVRSLPTAGKESFNLVMLRSPEVLNIVRGLGYSGAKILVIDAEQRVRAETGNYARTAPPPKPTSWRESLLARIRPFLHYVVTGEQWQEAEADQLSSEQIASNAIRRSLAGEPLTLRRTVGDQQELIVAAHPIVTGEDEVIGTVVVEQNIDQILSFQREALEQVIFFSIVSLFAVFIALLAFAGRLAWRIRNLRREASSAIDQYGRIRRHGLRSEMNTGDEIGDLARSVSNMLAKLHQHNTFLENMPRTLRHEINNPLNTLSTSLDNLASENPEVRDSKYLASAMRGVTRIGSIVQNLADAANLEEALQGEEFERIDLDQLLSNYVANCSLTHRDSQFVYRGCNHPVWVDASDFRIEQLLDKIIDNAVDFHRSNSPIKVQLDAYRDYLQLSVANRGPLLPGDAEKSLFDSMVSHRGPENRLHFGLGLYVVRVIAEYHGGLVRALNLPDKSGVAIIVQLPLAVPVEGAPRTHRDDARQRPASNDPSITKAGESDEEPLVAAR
ncbi:MAG: ATP-binding protein [Pseudomonadota bacterium]